MTGRPTQPSPPAGQRSAARSTGPRSTAGKAISAQNARKHGLFRTTDLSDQSQAVRQLAAALGELKVGDDSQVLWTIDTVLSAAQRLDEASQLVGQLRAEMCQMLAEEYLHPRQLLVQLKRLIQIGAYERRFRGQRDRALRALPVGVSSQE